MMYPVLYEEEVARAKTGKYGKKLVALFKEYPEGWLDISSSTYVFPSCKSFRHMRTLDFYEKQSIGPVHQIRRVPRCSTCRQERKKIDLDADDDNNVYKCCGFIILRNTIYTTNHKTLIEWE